jgi:hypothetical protein
MQAQEWSDLPPPPQVELRGAHQLPDGFRIEVDCDVLPPKKRTEVTLLGFTVRVPRRVGHTYIGNVFAEIQGRAGESRFYVIVDHHSHGDKEQYLVTVDRRFVRDCVVDIGYKAHPEDWTYVKNYVVRLKDYSPKPQT